MVHTVCCRDILCQQTLQLIPSLQWDTSFTCPLRSCPVQLASVIPGLLSPSEHLCVETPGNELPACHLSHHCSPHVENQRLLHSGLRKSTLQLLSSLPFSPSNIFQFLSTALNNVLFETRRGVHKLIPTHDCSPCNYCNTRLWVGCLNYRYIWRDGSDTALASFCFLPLIFLNEFSCHVVFDRFQNSEAAAFSSPLAIMQRPSVLLPPLCVSCCSS